jgi:hypothetical protein
LVIDVVIHSQGCQRSSSSSHGICDLMSTHRHQPDRATPGGLTPAGGKGKGVTIQVVGMG